MGKLSLANGRKALYYLKRNGLRATLDAIREGLESTEEYHFAEPSPEELDRQRNMHWEDGPMFSILVPTYCTREEYLLDMIDSVLRQTYTNLELVIADATQGDAVERLVKEKGREDAGRFGRERIRYLHLAENAGISGNTNSGLAKVCGDYVGLLDHDDVLTPDALFQMAVQIQKGKEQGRTPRLLYSDEDKCNQNRTAYFAPYRKPDFNLDLLLSNNYICHFLVMERGLIQSLGLRREYDGAQDYDLILRAVAAILTPEAAQKGWEAGTLQLRVVPDQIVHIPSVLYHWRCHSESTAENPHSKEYAYEAGRKALQCFADGLGWSAQAEHTEHMGFYRLDYCPDILTVRQDVGVVGGRILGGKSHRRRSPGKGYRKPGSGAVLVAGAYDEAGNVLYQGLREGFSGDMHRGALRQDVAAVDLRLCRVSPACRELFSQVMGVAYTERPDGSFCADTLPADMDIRELSLRLGEALREAGYRICWDPDWWEEC